MFMRTSVYRSGNTGYYLHNQDLSILVQELPSVIGSIIENLINTGNIFSLDFH